MNLKKTRFGDWSCGSFHLFLIVYCVVTSIQRIPGPFMGALLQSVERQFQISSRVAGTMLSAGDIGHISAVVLLAYFGSRGNRARWIGGGGLLIAFACLLISMPGYIFPQKDGIAEKTLKERGYNFSTVNGANGIDPIMMADAKLPFGYCSNETIHLKNRLQQAKCEANSNSVGNTAAYILLLTGIVLMGIGRSMPYTLGVPLIDDGIKNKRKAPLYFAAITCLRIFGPVFGMVLSAVCSGLYVNFKAPPGMTPYDPRWIGAWWLGFLVVSVTLVAPAIILICYPNVDELLKRRQEEVKHKKILVNGKTDSERGNMDSRTPQTEKSSEKTLLQRTGDNGASTVAGKANMCIHFLGFAAAIAEVLKSPIYTGRLVGRLFDAFAFKGMSAFKSKYLENHFGIPMYKANISIGFLGIGSFMTGVLLGSFVMKKFNLDGRRAAGYVAFCSITFTILTLCQAFLSCHSVVNQVGRDGAVHNYTYPACSGCDCTAAPLYPVCSTDGTPFYSPCHAGCKDYNRTMYTAHTDKKGKGGKFEFHSCSCVNTTKTGGDQRVSRDWCYDDCYTPMVLYFLISAIGAVIAGTGMIPGMLIGLRSVPKKHRSVALGFSTFIVGLISVLPSTPIYGMIIDAACLVWNKSCSGDRGACLIYNPTQLRRGIITMYVILHAIGDISDLFVWYKAKHLKLMPDEKDEEGRRGGGGGGQVPVDAAVG